AAPCTRRRARLASCRAAAGERRTMEAISSNGTPNISCNTKASRSGGASFLSTTRSASQRVGDWSRHCVAFFVHALISGDYIRQPKCRRYSTYPNAARIKASTVLSCIKWMAADLRLCASEPKALASDAWGIDPDQKMRGAIVRQLRPNCLCDPFTLLLVQAQDLVDCC